MKDRIPAPGKANRVRITQDDGQAVEGALTYVDDAIQAGSRYTKQNVLPDDVCDALNIDRGGAEPKDAFNACWAVGDIKTTTRASLGANWHACDGSNFVAAELPELGAIIEPSIERGFKRQFPLDSVYIPSAVKFVNGHCVVLGGKYSSGEGAIGYTDSLARGWSSVPLPNTGDGVVDWTDIVWDGSQYVALAVFFPRRSAGYCKAYIAYASQLYGPWALHDTSLSCDSSPRPRLDYSNGNYCFATRGWPAGGGLPATLFYSTAPASGWRESVIGPKGMSPYCAVYAFGYYIAGGYNRDGANEGFYAYSSDAENWTTVPIESPFNSMVFDNGILAAGDSDGNVWYTTNPAGNWAKKKIWNAGEIEWLTYDGEFIATNTQLAIARATTPNGDWRVEQWQSDIDFDANHPYSVIGAHNGVIANGYSGGTQNVQQVYAYTDVFRSYPLITPAEPAKAFIRVK